MKLYRREGDENKFLISHSYDNVPVAFTDSRKWLAAKSLFPEYITETPTVDYEIAVEEDNTQSIISFINEYVDYMILNEKLSNLVPKDNTEFIKTFIANNIELANQYTSGNQRILNSLVGKFLKENKGFIPQEVKAIIETELNKLL